MQFGLKQFDMVLIFSDFNRPSLQINSIPSAQLDDVKNWLEWVHFSSWPTFSSDLSVSSVDIPLSEGPVNLNWGSYHEDHQRESVRLLPAGRMEFLRWYRRGGGMSLVVLR